MNFRYNYFRFIVHSVHVGVQNIIYSNSYVNNMSGINVYKRKLLANKSSHIFHTFRLFSNVSLEEVLNHCKQKTYSNYHRKNISFAMYLRLE